MTAFRFAALGVLALAATACTQQPAPPAEPAPAPAPQTRTIVETREVAVPVPVSPPTVVIERDARPADSTTVRAGENGIEVETTRRN